MQDGKKRLFIISHEKFPRKSAGANYIQYLACALRDEGYSIIVIGENNDEPTGWGKNYKGIEYATYNSSSKNIIKSTFDIKECRKIFTYYDATSRDYFIFYNLEIDGMKHCVKNYGVKRLFGVRVEFMQPYQYKFHVVTPKYLTHKRSIYYMWKYFRGDFAISRLLKEQDITHRCSSMILPIMADPYEYEWVPDKKKGDIVQFIYPGMKLTGYEDDLDTAFSALAALDMGKLKKLRLHITGVKKDTIIEAISQATYEKIKDILVIHGFMPYDQLVKLYQSMDYLLLIRKVNEITEANFPSKIPELLSYGVVPVCTDVGDYTKGYLDSSCAIIIPPYDQNACVKAFERVVDMGQEEYSDMRKAARQLAEEKFYYKKWSRIIAAFIEENEEK